MVFSKNDYEAIIPVFFIKLINSGVFNNFFYVVITVVIYSCKIYQVIFIKNLISTAYRRLLITENNR